MAAGGHQTGSPFGDPDAAEVCIPCKK